MNGAGADWRTGETIDGRKVTSSSAALDLVTPFIVDDVLKGFEAEGLLGAAKATPGVLGVGVNFYDKPRRGERRGVSAPAPELNRDGIVEPMP